MLSEKKYTLVIALLPENPTEDIAVVTKLGTISELESKLDIASSVYELLACHKRTAAGQANPGSFGYMSLPDPCTYTQMWQKVQSELKPAYTGWWMAARPNSNVPDFTPIPMRPDNVRAWPTELSPELETVLKDFLPVKLMVDETVPTGYVKLIDSTGQVKLFNISELVAADQDALIRKTLIAKTNMAAKISEFEKNFEDAKQHVAYQQELEKARAAADQEANALAKAQLEQLEKQAEASRLNAAIDALNLKRGDSDFGQAIPKIRGI